MLRRRWSQPPWLRALLCGLALGVAGVAVGRLLRPATSHACDCSAPSWSMSLVSVVGPPGAPDHAEYWPSEAVVSPLPSTASLYFDLAGRSWEIDADAD